MSDPWADVRELEIYEEPSGEGSIRYLDGHKFLGTLSSKDEAEAVLGLLNRIVGDADALMAVARELLAQGTVEYAEDVMDWASTEPPDETFQEWLEHEWPALAALPEHLKIENP